MPRSFANQNFNEFVGNFKMRCATAALVALSFCLYQADATRWLQTSLRDGNGNPVSLLPGTVFYNFTAGDIRGSMQLEETDDRISDATHPEHLPQQVKVIYYGDRSVLVTWSTGAPGME